jgi:hypothetical protein
LQIFGHQVTRTQQHGESTIAVHGRNVQADVPPIPAHGLTRRRGGTSLLPMFGRKRRESRDFFKQASEDRRTTEDDTPWFLADDDGPALDVEAGRSARMDGNEDLGR